MRIFGLEIVSGKHYDEMKKTLVQLHNCADTNASRNVKLKKQYDILKSKKNEEIRELKAEIREFKVFLSYNHYESR